MTPARQAIVSALVLASVAAGPALHAAPLSGLEAMVCATELHPVQSPVPNVPGIATDCSPLSSAGTGAFVPMLNMVPTGPPDAQPVAVLKNVDLNSFVLLDRLFNLAILPELWVVWFAEVDGISKFYLRLKITNARVASLANGTASGEAVESLQFVGSSYEWTLYDPESLLDPPPVLGTFCWDLTKSSPC